MERLKLGVIFGGVAIESDLCLYSVQTILKNLDKEKYEVFPIYIGKDEKWYKYLETKTLELGEEVKNKEEITNVLAYLKGIDLFFIHLIGVYGKDGTIQGLLDSINKPYTGCGALSSCVGNEKAYAKILYEKAGLKQTKYEYIRKYKEKYFYVDKNFNEELLSIDEIKVQIRNNLKYPLFVKPSNSGSSYGVTKVVVEDNLKAAIEEAAKFDSKILIEEEVVGREVECAVLGNEEVIASGVGEIKYEGEFYSNTEKFNKPDKNDVKANISPELTEKIRAQAIKVFKIIYGRGLARVDFFIEKNTNEVYINEINTMPGFTPNSMYPRLFEEYGISIKDLLDKIIDLALEKH